MISHYKLISLRISVDGVRMINSGYDKTGHCFKGNNAGRQTKNRETSVENKSKSHLKFKNWSSDLFLLVHRCNTSIALFRWSMLKSLSERGEIERF